MTAYYNEIDPYCVQWLRALIAANEIAPGDVDDRDIRLVRPDDLRGYQQCHFFAGLGGWSAALRLAGVADDEKVWTGSCPCGPFSPAGKQRGFDDPRHLWPAWKPLIQECQPAVVYGEQSASAVAWLGLVRSDLEAMGFAVGAIPMEAACAGAPHRRKRFWFVADAFWDEQPRLESCRRPVGRVGRQFEPFPWNEGCDAALARFRTLDDGIPRCVAATDAARNAIVPQAAAEFICAHLASKT